MKSYAVIDRIEGEFAVCEVELLYVEDSNTEEYFYHDTTMIEVPVALFKETVSEGDVFVVEHDEDTVFYVHSKDDEEKKRRKEIFKKMMSS